jgi:hypothetical protein
VVIPVTHACCRMFASNYAVKIGSEVDPLWDTKISPTILLGGVEGGEPRYGLIVVKIGVEVDPIRRESSP